MSNRNNENNNNNNNNKRAKSPSELSDDGNNSKQTTPDHGTPYNNIENDNSHTKRARLAEQHQHDELKVATKKEEDAYPTTTTTTSTATTDTEEREEKIANKTEEAAGAVAVAAGAGATTTTTTTTSRSSSSSVSSSSSCLVLIPVEVVNIIFSFMDADTLFPSCIWVCVQWRRLAFAQFKPTTPPPATATGTTTTATATATATNTTTPHNNHQNSSSSSSSSRNNNNNNYSGALWNPDSINNSFIRYIASQEMLGGFLKDIITFRLSFELCWRVNDRGLKHLQRIAGAIAHLNLNYCYQISDKGLVDNLLMPPNAAKSDYCLSQLESLSLVCLDKITDRSVAAIAARCPRLRSLNLAMCTGITKRGLRELGALKQLRCLNLQQRNTFEISDRAVEKLRKNTLPVDCIVITQ